MPRQTILIVEDEEEMLRIILRKILIDYGHLYDPIVTIDGYEALDVMKNKNVAAVVLDIQIPNLNGKEVCRQAMLDAKMRKIPIIVSSGHLNKEEKEELQSLSVKHFLDKPYPLDVLFKKLSQVVKNEQAVSKPAIDDQS